MMGMEVCDLFFFLLKMDRLYLDGEAMPMSNLDYSQISQPHQGQEMTSSDILKSYVTSIIKKSFAIHW